MNKNPEKDSWEKVLEMAVNLRIRLENRNLRLEWKKRPENGTGRIATDALGAFVTELCALNDETAWADKPRHVIKEIK